MHNTDKVLINDLVIEMSAGIYEHEKQKNQRVIFNVCLDVESNFNKDQLTINDVVSYEGIANEIIGIAHEKHYDLLECLAEKISEHCLKITKVKKVNLRIEKPDIIDITSSVGIEIIRYQSQ